jgi:hypothetical protein
MKTLYSVLLLMLISTLAYSQAPEAFSYQAVIRNGAGDVLVNSQVAVQASILQGSEAGTAVYVERFNPTTNDHGLIALKLGKGNVQSGTFNSIDWGSDSYYIKIEVDPNNGTDFTSMGASQLLSVPYALYSASVSPAEVNSYVNRTISIPAHALGKSPSSTVITEEALGLRWQQDYSSPAFIVIRKPSNYSGGDVELSIFFETTTSTAGVVAFFIRARSANHGDGFFDAGSINSTGIDVSGQAGFGTLYEQNFTIPESDLLNDWWIISIQRQGTGSTYSDDVIVASVALTY